MSVTMLEYLDTIPKVHMVKSDLVGQMRWHQHNQRPMLH